MSARRLLQPKALGNHVAASRHAGEDIVDLGHSPLNFSLRDGAAWRFLLAMPTRALPSGVLGPVEYTLAADRQSPIAVSQSKELPIMGRDQGTRDTKGYPISGGVVGL